MSKTDSSRPRRFAIALSFPGERRKYVEQVANALLPAFGGEQGKARIFYDNWHEDEIIGYASNRKLQEIYRTESDLIVPFYCEDYLNKEWCGAELRAIEELLHHQEYHRVLPFRFDQVEIPSSFKTDIFPEVSSRPPEDVARLIIDRYRKLQSTCLDTVPSSEGGRSAGIQPSSISQQSREPNTIRADKPTMRIQRGIKIEVLDSNSTNATVVLDWDLPPMSRRFGAVATRYSPTWKRIHAHAERVYDTFRLAHIQMLLAHERRDASGGEAVTPVIERAVYKFRQFRSEIKDYPAEVSNAEHVIALQAAEKGFSALFWHLANSKPGTEEFMQAVLFVERLCTWCFEMLSRADQILEKYFETEGPMI